MITTRLSARLPLPQTRMLLCAAVVFVATTDFSWSPKRGFAGDFQTEAERGTRSLAPPRNNQSPADRASPFDAATQVEELRQMTLLLYADRSLEFYWVDVLPRRDPLEEESWVGQSVRGDVTLLWNLRTGKPDGRQIGYMWKRRAGWGSGGSQSDLRESHRKNVIDNHELFMAPEGRSEDSPLRDTGVLAFSKGEPSIPQSLKFVMAMPDGWLPVVKKFFADQKRLTDASPEDVLAELKALARGPLVSDGVLSQAFALFRLSESRLTAPEKATLAELTPPDGDFFMTSLWVSQWTIASYAHEDPVELAKRLDKLADAYLAKDRTVSRDTFMLLVAHMASYLSVGGDGGFPSVPFTPYKKPDEVACDFFVARVNHIRDEVAKLRKDTLSDWGKSIANYQFMPPFAPWPPKPAKEQSPKK